MSTYTDLHNRIKENLTILRKPGSKDDGMSPQKVILINPENQFYGTFNGKMNVTEGILSSLKIVNSELDNVKLDGATIDGVSLSELKDTIDVNIQDIEQLQKDAKYISASHDELSTGLSGAIDNLSSSVDEKLGSTVEEIKRSIGGVVGDVAILSDGFNDLSIKVEALSNGTLNGVVYRGQLVLHRDSYTLPRQLFNDDPACCLLEGTQASLKNGWMWRVVLDHKNISSGYVHVSDPNTGKELDLGEGDYIIIKNHLTSLYEVVPDNQMRLDDFDVINAQDEDDSKIQELRMISGLLDTKIDILSDNLLDEIETDRRTIKEVSAETLRQAKSYTNEEIISLSGTTSSLIQTVSAETLAQAKIYANGISSELCTTVNNRLSDLSNDLSSYSKQLCTVLSNQVDAEFVHKAGDTIAKLFVTGDLDIGGKTTINHDFGEAGGTKLELSQDKVELKTFAPLSISSSNDSTIAGRNIELNADSMSINLEDGDDDLFVNGESLKSKLDKKLNIDLARELSSKLALSDDISWELSDYNNSAKFLISSEISCGYVNAENKIRLVVQGNNIDIDVADLFANKIIKKAGVEKTENGTFLYIEFDIDGDSTTEGSKIIKIKIDEFFRPYEAGYGISVDNELRINISKEFDDQVQAIQKYVDELSGPVGPYIGIIPSLSNEISSLRHDEKFEVQFKNLPVDTGALSERYDSIGAFLCAQLQPYDFTWVRNNTEYLVQFLSGDDGVPLSANIAITDSIGTLVGNGDIILIHAVDETSTGPSKVDFSEMVPYNRATKHGNTFIIKAGVSRYEFEAEATKRADDDNYISSWLSTNFGNTVDVDVSPTTIFNQNLSATKDLSVQNDAFILSNLCVSNRISTDSLNAREAEIAEDLSSKNMFVSNKLKVDSELDVLSGSLWCHKSENGSPYIKANGEYITIEATNEIARKEDPSLTPQNSIVKVDPSYISISSNQIDLSANEILVDFRNLKNFQNLSSAAQIHTALSVAIDKKIFIDGLSVETLSAIHISQQDYYDLVSSNSAISNVLYIVSSDYINAYGEQIKNLAQPTDLSDATTKEYVDSISSSLSSQIQQLSDDLSSEVSSLEDTVISNDACLSTAIDKKIFIDGLSAESLSATHISEVDFYQRVKDGQILSNELYIVSSDYINAYGQQIKNLAAPTELSDAATKQYVDDISSSLSSQIQQLSDDLSSEISSLEDKAISNDACLSTAIDKKIFIDGLSTESLCAIHISQDDFYQRVEKGEISSNEFYIISSNYINAYGEQIKNLAKPIDLSDAATKEYVDNADSSISGQLSGLISAIYDDLEHVATDSIISSLEQKSCISNVICAVVGIRDTLVDLRQTLSTMLGLR